MSDEVLADLQHRLKSTRWPVGAGNDDWYYGVGRNYLEGLIDYWMNEFDWRKAENSINAYEHYRVNADGGEVSK
ncbi:epoxide hydrolase N-terminal domain-containing protein [Paenibacillus apii]|uniref:epoxide hydrolase N-terminal domain-containing protein n=1 Tax=Paenibacillus apii TaxID=1850370 RepID=UPI002E28640D|nr:epoxide hydrolase N-terminal domain-containing protein [Paenibacillus apii]